MCRERFCGGTGLSPSRKKSRNLPFEFVEDELLMLKGRLEGEEDIIEKGGIDDMGERGS
jgi:hypothetical protein